MNQKNVPVLFAVAFFGLIAYCAWVFGSPAASISRSLASEPSPTSGPCSSPTAIGIQDFPTPIPGPCRTSSPTTTATSSTATASPSPSVTASVTSTTTPPIVGPKLEITLPIAKSGAKPDEMLFGGEKFDDLMRPICRIAPGCLSRTLTGLPGRYYVLVTLVKDPANSTDENYQYYVVTINGFTISAPAGSPTATATDPGGSPSPGSSPSPDSSPGQGGGGGGGTGWLPNLLFGSSRTVSFAR